MDAIEERIQRIEVKSVYIGAQVRVQTPAGVTVDCNLYRTFHENALAAYRGLRAAIGTSMSQQVLEELVEIFAYSSTGSALGNVGIVILVSPKESDGE